MMDSKPTGFLCGPRIYRYRGWTFEVHPYWGPWPHRKDGEHRQRAGRVFWAAYEAFAKLPPSKQARCRIGGGCRRI